MRDDVRLVSDLSALATGAAFVVGLVVLGFRLAQIQLVDAAKYLEDGSRQAARRVQTAGPRGRIIARDGTVLADNRASVSIVVNPEGFQRRNWTETVSAISNAIESVASAIDAFRERDRAARPPAAGASARGLARLGRRADRALRRARTRVSRLRVRGDGGADLSRGTPRGARDRLRRARGDRERRGREVQLQGQGDEGPRGVGGVLRRIPPRRAGRAFGDGRRARLRRRGGDGRGGAARTRPQPHDRPEDSALRRAAAPRRIRRVRGDRSEGRRGARARERAGVRPQPARSAPLARDAGALRRQPRVPQPRLLRDIRARLDVQAGDGARGAGGRALRALHLRMHRRLRARGDAAPLREKVGARSDRHAPRAEGELQHLLLQPRL